MIHSSHLHPEVGLTVKRAPWLFFLFLTVLFFLSYRNLSINPQGVDNEDASSDQFATSVSGTPVTHFAQILLAIGAVITLIRYRAYGHLRINGISGFLFLTFVGWAFISPLWAEHLQLTVQRLGGFAILCIAAAAVTRRLSLREIIIWTFLSTAMFLFLGILVEVLFGTFHPFASGYRFAGSLGPNDQGVECGILLLSAAAAADVEIRRRGLFWACGILGFIFLVLSGSRTALAASVLALVVYEAAVRSKRSKIVAVFTACILSCLVLLLLGAGLLPNLRSAILLGRDDPDSVDSFSGRTMIWQDLEQYIRERPILGSGYGGFWTPNHIEKISDEENHGVPNGHSTYVDYLLTLGAVGLAAYSGLLLAAIRDAFRCHKRSHDPAFAFCGALLVFCAVHGFLESGSAERGILKFLCMVVLVRLAFEPPQQISWSDCDSWSYGNA
jgi:exopolysaccharide production protein ExoQ